MADVPAGYGAYLKSPARYAATTITGASTVWGDKALDSEVISPLALQIDAQSEATRQAQTLAGPLVKDSHVIKGRRRDLIGKPVLIYNPLLGYGGGSYCYVIGAVEASDSNTTTLTVIKALAA